MKPLFLLCLAACGAPTPPTPACAPPVGAGTDYPLVAAFDGSRGLVLRSAAAPIGTTVRARLRNAAGNDPENATELYAFLAACDDGRYLRSVVLWDVPANASPDEWQQLETQLNQVETLDDAAQVVLLVRPLWARGQHLVDVDGFEVQ